MEDHYMVELDFFNEESFDEENLEREINTLVTYFRNSGKLVSMGLNMDLAIFWLVIKSNTEDELTELIENVPLNHEVSYDYFLLNHYEIIQEIGSFSLN